MTIDHGHIIIGIIAIAGWLFLAFLIGYRAGESDTEHRLKKQAEPQPTWKSRTEMPEPTL